MRRSPSGSKRSLFLFGLAAALAFGVAACRGGPEGAIPGAGEAGAAPSDVSVTITFRQFSSAPSLARGEGSSDAQSPEYGALRIFMDRVEAATTALGPGRAVVFALESGGAAFADVEAGGLEAAHISGGSLNEVWGFLYNSIPFGPAFPEMIDFLHDGGGVDLINRTYDMRGVDVVAFPVVGSPPQGSGYFQSPIGAPACPEGDAECESTGDGIGLEGLCAQPWTLRYLPPAETIIDTACDRFEAAQRVEFIQAIPGGSAFLTAVQQGVVEGFEFASPLDDYDAEKGGFFENAEAPDGSDGRNIGEAGLRFLHYPAWHQPFFLGWMVINRSQVWDKLDPDQQAAIISAAKESVVDSFNASRSVACDYLRRILHINDGRRRRSGTGETLEGRADMIPTRWTAEDLARLREAAQSVLENPGRGAASATDAADYETIMNALLKWLGHSSVADMLDAWVESETPGPGGCRVADVGAARLHATAGEIQMLTY